jgi:hypothetical protein
MEEASERAAMNQADWARRLRVLGMASEASARRSMEAVAKMSRWRPAWLTCQLR